MYQGRIFLSVVIKYVSLVQISGIVYIYSIINNVVVVIVFVAIAFLVVAIKVTSKSWYRVFPQLCHSLEH